MKKILLLLFTSTVFTLTAYAQGDVNANSNIPTAHNEWTIARLRAAMAAGKLTSVELTREYIARIPTRWIWPGLQISCDGWA
jgi:hypothetical protein